MIILYNIPLPFSKGIVIWPFVFIKYPNPFIANTGGSIEREKAKIILKHEFIHVEQIKRYKPKYLFYFYYWLENIKNLFKYLNYKQAYMNNIYEIEAYKRQYEAFTKEEMEWLV